MTKMAQVISASATREKGPIDYYASAGDFVTYRTVDQLRLGETRQILRCSHTQSRGVSEGSRQHFGLQPHWESVLACIKHDFWRKNWRL